MKTAWMYLTPIIYPKEILPPQFRWLFNLNPMYHLMEIFRAPLLIGWLAGPKTVLASLAAAVVAVSPPAAVVAVSPPAAVVAVLPSSSSLPQAASAAAPAMPAAPASRVRREKIENPNSDGLGEDS